MLEAYGSTAVQPDDGHALTSHLTEELDRMQAELAAQPDPPHWIAFSVVERSHVSVDASHGAASSIRESKTALLDVDVRVGTPDLDSTHKIRDAGWFDQEEDSAAVLPIDLVPSPAFSRALWRATDDAYRASVKRLIKVRANLAVKVEQSDPSPDFSAAPPVVDVRQIDSWQVDGAAWKGTVRAASERFLKTAAVHDSNVSFEAIRRIRTMVTTDGSRVRVPESRYRINIWAETTAADGMNLSVTDHVEVRALDKLPSPEDLNKRVDAVAEKVAALAEAPVVDPWMGPAILRGRAAAVFFHEVLGHRVEGHRQKDEDEGQTFTDKIGESVLPKFISVTDDPTRLSVGGVDLAGSYSVDDEAVAAQPVTVVQRGVLKGFLTSRSPIDGFPTSNGHGRRQLGLNVVARQGNLIVEAHKTVSDAQLRSRLLSLLRRQRLEFGYIIDDISGGFTFTGRVTPNAFSVQPITVWRVWVDGRPDELVRGVDLIGTPLTTFSRILAAGDTPAVFNGSCGAESGWVPVSAVSPNLLIGEVEVQRSEKGHDRPPLLAPPVVNP